MRKKRGAPFTLLEMLVVMALLALSMGAVALRVREWIALERFRTHVEAVVQRLSTAQELMALAGLDSEVILEKEKGVWHCDVIVERASLPQLYPLLPGKVTFQEVAQVHFHSPVGESFFSPIVLPFGSKGSVLPVGTLELVSRRGERRWIELKGQVAPVKAVTEKKREREEQENREALYPKAVAAQIEETRSAP